MGNSRRRDICNIDVHRASPAKSLKSKIKTFTIVKKYFV